VEWVIGGIFVGLLVFGVAVLAAPAPPLPRLGPEAFRKAAAGTRGRFEGKVQKLIHRNAGNGFVVFVLYDPVDRHGIVAVVQEGGGWIEQGMSVTGVAAAVRHPRYGRQIRVLHIARGPLPGSVGSPMGAASPSRVDSAAKG